MRLQILVLVTLVVAGCMDDGEASAPDPASCPAPPFEVCGYRDGGWDVFCHVGVIYEIDHNGALYCNPGETSEVVCDSVDETARLVRACPSSACNADSTKQMKYLETVDEYSKFDVTSVCAP
jgi:hypothetical protein